MELLKIEQVIVGSHVGSEKVSTPAEIKSEPPEPVAVKSEAVKCEAVKSEPVIREPVTGTTSSLQPYQHNLQCFQCFITFIDAKAKERHMKKSHREEYKQHLQQTDTVFTCYVCPRSFWSSDALTQHQLSHSTEDKPFICTYCQESFRTFGELTTHRREECSERQYVCKDCHITFRSASRLRTHRFAVHPLAEGSEDFKTYRCDKCSRRFLAEEDLLHHQENYQNCETHKPKRGRPPKKAAWEEEEGDDEGAAENGPKRRGRPPKEPQPELKIPCPEANCPLVFPSVAALRVHKKEQHGPRKAHPCTECEESYARPEQLKTHVARAHSSVRHNCPTCGKSFGRESNLKAHQKTHTEGEEAVDEDEDEDEDER